MGPKQRSLSIILGFVAVITLLHPALPGSEGKLRVLVLSGKNNHAWQETTPVLKKIYEDSARFVVDVLTDPSTWKAQTFQNYDAIASNWTNFPSSDREWGPDVEKALLEFVRSGKGFVLFHAAAACFPTWTEYQNLIGATWGSASGHGAYCSSNVSVEDREHPVTKVIGDFVITDELYHRLETRPAAHILCTAYSDKAQGGTGQQEPVAISTNFGSGRCFYLALGHDIPVMSNPNWKMLLLRGTEWAATGKATVEVPCDVAKVVQGAAGYRRSESREALAAIELLVQSSLRNPALRRQLADAMGKTLESEATDDGKKFLCEQLSLVGTAVDVPILIRMLGDKELGFHARLALERIPGNETLEALRAATGSQNGRPLIGVINTLGERRDPQAVDVLSRFIKDGEDRKMMSAAIQALGKIGGHEAAQMLIARRERIPAELQLVLADSLLSSAEWYETSGERGEAAKIFQSLIRPDEPPHIRETAFLGAGRCEKDGGEKVFIDALRSKDEALQSTAIRALGTLKSKILASIVAGLMLTLPEFLQPQAIYALANCGDAAILPLIDNALSSKSQPVRLAAIYALGRLGDSLSVDRLSKMIEGADETEVAGIRRSLAYLSGSDVDKQLISMLAGSIAAAVKREMIIALAARGSSQAVPAILGAAQDKDSHVRREALKALGKLADESVGPALIRMLKEERDSDERPSIEMALVAVARRDQTSQRALDLILAELPESPPQAKESLLRVLGSLGGDKALQAVRTFSKDTDPDIRNAAIGALADWPDDSPLADLLETARTSQETRPKVLALRGVANLVEKSAGLPDEEKARILEQALKISELAEVKKLLLGALGKLPSLRALQSATSNLDQPEIGDEAAMAVATISQLIGKEHPKEAHKALLKALEHLSSPAVADKLNAVLEELGFQPHAERIKVVVVTGGHDFDQDSFFQMFKSYEDIAFIHLPLADESEVFEDISRWPYDVIVLYNMTQKISAKRQENFIRLLDMGVGVLALHHASGAFQDWREFQKIIGCRYYLTAAEANGKKSGPSSYQHDVDIAVHISDASHPVTRGLPDFSVHDETYKDCGFEPDNRILLTTDEPSSDKPLCCVRNYRQANICYLQLGHGTSIFSDGSYRRLVAQALRWCAEKRLRQREQNPSGNEEGER